MSEKIEVQLTTGEVASPYATPNDYQLVYSMPLLTLTRERAEWLRDELAARLADEPPRGAAAVLDTVLEKRLDELQERVGELPRIDMEEWARGLEKRTGERIEALEGLVSELRGRVEQIDLPRQIYGARKSRAEPPVAECQHTEQRCYYPPKGAPKDWPHLLVCSACHKVLSPP